MSAIEDQKLGNQTLPAAVITQGPTKYIILFDRTTKLPAAVRTRDEDNIWGDANYDLVLSDWKTVNGVKIAHSALLQARRHGNPADELQGRHAEHRRFRPATFAIPDAVKAAAKPAATGNVPYQWVLRRIFLGRFTDSDTIYFPPDGSFKLVELAPNVQMVQGGGANNLIVNMKDGLVVVDAPTDEGQSKWVIDAAKAKYPGKPIKTLVLTHHHMDHTGGMRAFAAEGATVIVPAPDKAYFEEVIKRPAHARAGCPAEGDEAGERPGVKDTIVAQGRQRRDQPLQHPEPARGRLSARARASRTTSCGSPTSCRRADRSAAIPARSRSAMRCASTTSPARRSPAATAPPPSRPTSRPALAAN